MTNCDGKGSNRAQELCESRGGRPVLAVLSCPYGLCGRKATLNWKWVGLEKRKTTPVL